MVTLKKILDDVQATFPGDIRDFDSTTVINWINESYIEVRDEFIRAGRLEQFAVSQQLMKFVTDRQIPYLKYAALREPVLQHADFDDLVVYAICRSAKQLRDQQQTWEKGDTSWIGNDLFKAVSDINNLNTFGLTFQNCEVRNYYPNNGLRYKKGDVVIENGAYYRAVEDTINDSDDLLNTRPEWEQVYWKYKGIGFIDPEIINFSIVDRKKSAIDTGATVMSFDRDRVYVSHKVVSAEVAYIPVHQWKRKNKDEFQIPDIAISTWRNLVHERMYRSRGQIVGDNE